MRNLQFRIVIISPLAISTIAEGNRVEVQDCNSRTAISIIAEGNRIEVRDCNSRTAMKKHWCSF